MLPYSFIGTGSYTNAASALPATVALPAKPDLFLVRNLTGWGSGTGGPPITTYTAVANLESWIFPYTMAAGSFRQMGQSAVSVAAASLYATQGTSNGFTFIDSASPPTFAALAITTPFINATSWVVSMSNTGSIAVGDYVRVLNPTAMLQAGGIVAQVTAVSVNTSITLGYIASSVSAGASFTTNSTGGSILKFYRGKYYPKKLQVMHVTQATQAVVYFAEKNDFTPGQMVDFNVPTTYGMIQLSFLTKGNGPARVLSVTNSSTVSSITLDLDTTGFTAFAYPTSAASVGATSPPFCFPAGSGIVPLSGSATVPQSPPGTNLLDAFDNLNQFYMYIGSSVVGADSAVMQWEAYKADFGNLSNA